MTSHTFSYLAIATLLSASLFACSGEDPSADNAAGSGGSAGTAGSAGTGGDATDSPSSEVGQNAQVSDCGGFGANNRDAIPYCDAELLRWSYDASSQTLSLLDQRAFLNCCGDRTFTVNFDPDRNVYTATEIDSPEMVGGEGARCGCMCSFDWITDVVDVEPGTINLELGRHVTDDDAGAQTVWSGQLDLMEVQGQVVVDDQPLDYGCDTAMD